MSPKPPRFPLPLDRIGAPAGSRARTQPAARAAIPAPSPPMSAGLGLDTYAFRARMVDRIRAEGILCAPVLDALAQVPRHAFIDGGLAAQAYEDTSLPIGHGQTISKPSVVARMLALLFERRGGDAKLGRVLEIGTGCGYQAALLSRLAVRVISIERLRPLHDKARDNLASLPDRHNLRLVYGDGHFGHPPNAPYDAIVCAAGGDNIPQAWLDQLAIGGRLVAPTQSEALGMQVLVSVDRDEKGWSRLHHEGVRFVPLRSGTG
jgi:protein-L-isoaspartate(D-aspartate) O-methyltransferase